MMGERPPRNAVETTRSIGKSNDLGSELVKSAAASTGAFFIQFGAARCSRRIHDCAPVPSRRSGQAGWLFDGPRSRSSTPCLAAEFAADQPSRSTRIARATRSAWRHQFRDWAAARLRAHETAHRFLQQRRMEGAETAGTRRLPSRGVPPVAFSKARFEAAT